MEGKLATLMTFKSASGKTDRCDAKCYNAKGSKCVCCCGGANHGVGFRKAFKNTVEHFEDMVKASEKISDPKLRVSNIKQNKKFIRYFEDLKKQATLFGSENEDQLLERIKNVKLK